MAQNGLIARAERFDLFWFVAAIMPMVGSQVVRLYLSDAGAWLVCDYVGRLAALLFLAALPAARHVAFHRRKVRIGWLELSAWLVATVVIDRVGGAWPRYAVPFWRLGEYPEAVGYLHAVDMLLGLALVAFTEEVVFRRCAYHVLERHLANRLAIIIASALIFGAFHWWSGLGNVLACVLFGCVAMAFYIRCGALWPVVAAHYVADVVAFA